MRAALEQARTRHGRIDVTGALEEHQARLDTEAGRHEFYRQRLAESAPVPDDDGREFDLDRDKDRQDYMKARLQGEEFEDAADDVEEW